MSDEGRAESFRVSSTNYPCKADDYRRKLVGLVGRTASPHYAIDPAVLGGYVRILNRENNRYLWLRVRGRTRFAFVEPRAFRVAFDAATPDEVRQLRREALTHYGCSRCNR